MKKLLQQIKEALEVVVAALMLVEITLFFVSYGATRFDYLGFIAVLREHREFISYATLLTGFSLVVVLTSNRFMAKLQIAQAEVRTLGGELKKRSAIAEKFRVLADLNAQRDLNIFSRLLKISERSAEITLNEIEFLIWECTNNIKQNLNVIADIFTIATGCTSAACVQIIEYIDGTNKNDAIIKTIARDQHSAGLRGDVAGHRVGDNTIHQRVFIEDNELVTVDDLKSEEAGGRFRTSSKNWHRFYNSVLIAAIPPMSAAIESGTTRATLCVDNRSGGLNNDFCERLARELVLRLSVKLHCVNELQKASALYVTRT